MGMKRRKDYSKAEYKNMTQHLMGCAIFALSHLSTKTADGFRFDMKTGKALGPWQDEFMDALDLCGYKVDRKAYWEQKDKKR